jgi:hypothetical protein
MKPTQFRYKINPERPASDFYRTPPAAVKGLLDHVSFEGPIWEPACGDGAISEALKAAGYTVFSSDLYDWGYGVLHDFLTEGAPGQPNIVTNPPYRQANEFIRRALEFADKKVAMLLKLVALEGIERYQTIYRTAPPRLILPFVDRISIYHVGVKEPEKMAGGMITFAWFVWEYGYQGKPEIEWINNAHSD